MKQENNIEAIRDGKIRAIEEQFNDAFPYLQLSITNCKNNPETQKQLREAITDGSIIKQPPEAELDSKRIIDETMTVEQLETILLNEFGCNAKVYRRSGNVWLQTKFTNGWTLKEQNQMGKDTS
jgi:hypothetical protein